MTTLTADLRPRPVYRAQLSTMLAIAFFALLSFPVLIEMPAGVSPGQFLMLAGFPIWFAASLGRERTVFDDIGSLSSAAILLCSGLLIFWALVSAFHVDVPFRAARAGVSLLTAFALFFLMAGTVTQERLFIYINVLCLALAATSIVTVVALAEPALQPIIFQDKDRAFGFFKNPNQFGIAISTVLPVAVAMLFAVRQRRLLWASCVVLLWLGLIASGSKANLLVSAVTLPFCLMLFASISYAGRQRVWMVSLTAIACLIAGGLVVLALSLVNPRALSLLGDFVLEGEATRSLVSRSVLWADSMDALRTNPILGVGAGQPIHGLSHSHNVLMDYGRTLGVPGIVLMSIKLAVILAVCTSTIYLALRSGTARLADRYLCLGMAFGPVAYIGANFSSDSWGPTTSPFLYSVLFLGLASRRLLTSPVPAKDAKTRGAAADAENKDTARVEDGPVPPATEARVEAPADEILVVEEPVVEQHIAEEPAAEKAAVEEPASGEAMAEDAVAEDAATEDSATAWAREIAPKLSVPERREVEEKIRRMVRNELERELGQRLSENIARMIRDEVSKAFRRPR